MYLLPFYRTHIENLVREYFFFFTKLSFRDLLLLSTFLLVAKIQMQPILFREHTHIAVHCHANHIDVRFMLACLFRAEGYNFSIYVCSVKEKQLQLNTYGLLVTPVNVDRKYIKSIWNLSLKSRVRSFLNYNKANLAASLLPQMKNSRLSTLMKKISGVANPEQQINYIANYPLSVLMEGTSDVDNQNTIYIQLWKIFTILYSSVQSHQSRLYRIQKGDYAGH